MKIARNILKQGFSLIELLVVVAIIGILAAIGSVGYTRYIKISQDRAQLANLIELMNALGTTYIGLSTNQIQPNELTYQNCFATLITSATLNDSISGGYNPGGAPPPQDCAGYLTTNFKSPYNPKDVGGIGGDYVISPCTGNISSMCSLDSGPLYNSSGISSFVSWPDMPNPAHLKDDGSGNYQYSDGTNVMYPGKILYYDQSLYGQCRFIYFQACHSDGSEDDGILMLTPSCRTVTDWSTWPNIQYSTISDPAFIASNFLGAPWLGAKIFKQN